MSWWFCPWHTGNLNWYDLFTCFNSWDPKDTKQNNGPLTYIVEIANLVLSSNVFSFDDNYLKQIFGTAMGKIMVPLATNFFMGWLESQLLAKCPDTVNNATFHHWHFSSMDRDPSGTGYILQPHQLLQPHHQVHHHLLHRTTAISGHPNQLEGQLLANGYPSQTHRSHANLHNSLCHPRHLVKNIPYSQFLRLRCLCTDAWCL